MRAIAEKRKRQQDLALSRPSKKSARSKNGKGGITGNKMSKTGGSAAMSTHSRQVVGTSQIEQLNEGDRDLQEYLEPLIGATGSGINEL